MAALSNVYFAPHVRGSALRCLKWRPEIEWAELAARVSGAVAEVMVFLWASLSLAFFGLIAAVFWVA